MCPQWPQHPLSPQLTLGDILEAREELQLSYPDIIKPEKKDFEKSHFYSLACLTGKLELLLTSQWGLCK